MERFYRVGIAGAALLLALAACAKSSETSTTTTTTASSAAVPAASASANTMVASNGAQASDGAKVFQTNCSSCHQANGQGVPGTFPPLAGNAVVVGDSTTVIHILKYGLNGKIAVKGTSYNGMMPAWGQQLSSTDIASAITYIRSAWGNKASAVTAAQVKAVAQ